MKTVAIIQARMGSTRLPGKVLLDLCGQPMLARVVERVRASREVDEVVVATTTEMQDNAIAALCGQRRWRCYRGSALDVLDRYYQAALSCGADVVVRITADNPLVDPGLIDLVISEFQALQPLDLAVCNPAPRTFPYGLDVEVFSFAALACAWREDKSPSGREHVTPSFYANPERFSTHGVGSDVDYSYWRWTVDVPEDLELMRRIYEYFGRDDFNWREAIAVLEEHPEWSGINGHIQQRSAAPSRLGAP